MKTLFKTISIVCLATIGVASAYAQEQNQNERRARQKQEAVGNTKTNVDFSKYRTFTWAKPDPTQAGDNGYDIYYYEFEPANKVDKIKQGDNVTTQEPYIYSYGVIIPA